MVTNPSRIIGRPECSGPGKFNQEPNILTLYRISVKNCVLNTRPFSPLFLVVACINRLKSAYCCQGCDRTKQFYWLITFYVFRFERSFHLLLPDRVAQSEGPKCYPTRSNSMRTIYTHKSHWKLNLFFLQSFVPFSVSHNCSFGDHDRSNFRNLLIRCAH